MQNYSSYTVQHAPFVESVSAFGQRCSQFPASSLGGVRLALARSKPRNVWRRHRKHYESKSSSGNRWPENVWQKCTGVVSRSESSYREAFSPVCVEIGLPKLQFLLCAIFNHAILSFHRSLTPLRPRSSVHFMENHFPPVSIFER